MMHESMYSGITEQLLFANTKYERLQSLKHIIMVYFKIYGHMMSIMNCDKLKTAEELYIHENTLRYRLHQIGDVMDCDLKNVNTITDIVTALKVRRMLQILDKV